MKHSWTLRKTIITAWLLLPMSLANVRAANGTWTGAVDGVWSDPANWLGGTIADGAGSTATFDQAATVVVNLDSPRTVGSLFFVQGVYTITNNAADATNILTLQGAAKPVISIPTGTAATIRRTVIAGNNGFIVDGGGTLNIFKQNTDPTNTWTGGIVLTNNSTLQVQGINVGNTNFANFRAFGSGPITFMDGTLNIQPAPNTSPSYGAVNNDLVVPEGRTGTIILPVRFADTGDNTAAPGPGLGGTLTGGGTLNVVVRYVRGNIPGDWSAFTGQINVTPGSTAVDNEWRFGNAAGFPNASVNLGGTSPLRMHYYVQPAVGGSTVIPIGVLSSDNPASFVSGSSAAGRTLTYRVGAKLTNSADTATFVGELRNVPAGVDLTPRLAIIKEGAGTWILTGTNTHAGGTTISSGVLQIGDGFSEAGTLGIGPITNNGALVIARGGTLTVPAAISGSGSVTNNGPGSTVTLAGANSYSGRTVISAGKLVIGTGSALTGACTINDSASLGALVTSAGTSLSLGSITFGSTASFDFDLSTFGNPSVAVVTNSGAVALNANVTVNVAGRNLALLPGTMTLFQYASRSGTGAFVLGTLPSGVTATLNDDTANRRLTLTITAVLNPTLRWVGNAAGNWDVGVAANQVWREIGSGRATNYYDGAPVRFDDTATGSANVNLTGPVLPLEVTVNNSTLAYRFGGSGLVSGSASLTKQGSGKLTITTANDNTGGARIDAGTLQIGDGGGVGQLGPGNIVNNGELIVNRNDALTVSGDITGGGKITVVGDGSVNSVVTFTPSTPAASSYSGGTIVSNAIVVMGNAAANGLDAAGTGLGTGPVTFYGNSGLYLFQSDAGGANNATGNGGYDFGLTLNVPAGQTLDYHVTPRSAERTVLLGAGTVNLRAAGIRCYVVGGDWSQFTGRIVFSGYLGAADLRLNSTNDLPLARVHLANTDGSGDIARMMNQGDGQLRYRIGELSGDVGTEINANNGDGGDAPASTVWVVGGLNTDATFAGLTSDPANADHSFVKEGTGKWTLSGTNLHQGFTTVNNGVLALLTDAGLSNSVTVTAMSPGILDVTGRTDGTLALGTGANGQTLAGDGTIRGNVLLGANARLSPGLSIGMLTVTGGSVTLGGTSLMEIDVASASGSDRLVAAKITYGGTLILTNIGGTISGTKTLQLFNGTIAGTFANVITQQISGVTWDLSRLNVDGTVRLVSSVAPPAAPAFGGFSISGTTLTLTGSGGIPGSPFNILGSTNVVLPLAQWTQASTGTFDATGKFTASLPVGTNELARFFVVRTP